MKGAANTLLLFFRRSAPLVACYALALLAGAIAARTGIPLPWMIGPLISTAALSILGGLQFKIPVETRPIGQLVVATYVGLNFTPAALAVLIDLAPLMVGMALTTTLAALLGAVLLSRLSGCGLAQAVLAMIPASPVESANIAQKLGYDPAPVVLTHTLRIAAVVLLIPIGLYAVQSFPDRGVVPDAGAQASGINLGLLLLTGLVALLGVILCRIARLPNVFFMGPLFAVAAVSAVGIELHAVPAPVLVVAQVVLGTWLGSIFRRRLFLSAGRQILAPALSSMTLIVLSAGFALAISTLATPRWEVLVLGTSPGGVTEMALTAKYLGEDVAIVTAFQLVRIFLIMPLIPSIVAAFRWWEERSDAGRSD